MSGRRARPVDSRFWCKIVPSGCFTARIRSAATAECGHVDLGSYGLPRATFKVSGSVHPNDLRARYRAPVVGWHHMCKFDHDFLGRAALEAEVANPKRTVVTLRWNPDDVIDTWASLFRSGEPYKTFDLPYAPDVWPQAHADHIVKDGHRIGISSGTSTATTSAKCSRWAASTWRRLADRHRSDRPVGRLRSQDQGRASDGRALHKPDRGETATWTSLRSHRELRWAEAKTR
jgi:hypothetical protein